MQRIRLFLGMAALATLMCAAVVIGSPYSPVVQVCPENIEDVWAIEDTRSESETPLVTMLENNGVPLAYDVQENTFYCTLGMENAESWPSIHLHAPRADGVSLMFVDDYEYDYCADAIREGYPYQVMAYTDTEFAYFDIVFTGMTQIHIYIQDELSREDIPARVVVSDEKNAVESNARIHHRGGATIENEKKGIRIEFTRDLDGTHKIQQNVPGIGDVQNLVFLPLYVDETMMRDKFCWEMYGDMTRDSESFSARKTEYVELFVNNRYEGVYLMMEPYDSQKELAKYSVQNPAADSVYRVSLMLYASGRLTYPGAYRPSRRFELYYTAPQSVSFDDLKIYMEMAEEEDDEKFVHKALACMDMEYAMRYTLLLQGLGLTDNVFNNLNIWARHDGSQVIYHYFPWDMDLSLGARPDRIGEDFDQWICLPAVDRMLSLNAGRIREKIYDMWTGLREGGWNMESVESRISRYAAELNDSGAFARNAQRWNLEKSTTDGEEIFAFISTRFSMLDKVLSKFAAYDGKIDLLGYTDYTIRSLPISDWL